MNEQIKAAVQWWCDVLLSGARQDNGDVMTNVFAKVVQAAMPPILPGAIDIFGVELIRLLELKLPKTWRPNDPQFGAYFRALDCDYGPDLDLTLAAEMAGIPATCPPFPMKTTMWINPDQVRVRYGYGADIVTVWKQEAQYA